MSTPAEIRLATRVLRHELEAIKGNWGWFLTLGIILIVVGTMAVGMPFIASLASVVLLGMLLIMGGIVQLVGTFLTRDWSGFFLTLLMGVLYLVLGVMFLRHPGGVLEAMTLLLACGLMVSGLFRIIGSLMYKFPYWGWTLAGGAINLLLGIYIYSQWPLDSFFVLGLFVGVDLIFTGWTWVMLALAIKNVRSPSI
ncbi:MAG: HdeD family acid-resistance protein [Isosphaeraceae bacterium]